jgi:hypothetical protein
VPDEIFGEDRSRQTSRSPPLAGDTGPPLRRVFVFLGLESSANQRAATRLKWRSVRSTLWFASDRAQTSPPCKDSLRNGAYFAERTRTPRPGVPGAPPALRESGANQPLSFDARLERIQRLVAELVPSPNSDVKFVRVSLGASAGVALRDEPRSSISVASWTRLSVMGFGPRVAVRPGPRLSLFKLSKRFSLTLISGTFQVALAI